MLLMLLQPLSGFTSSSTMVLSQHEYDRLCQLEFSQNGHSSTHGLFKYECLHSLSSKTLDIRSEVSSYMTGIKQKLVLLHLSNKLPSVNIVDGTKSPVLGNGVVQGTHP